MFVIVSDSEASKKEATRHLSILAGCKNGPLNTKISSNKKQIGTIEVLEILIEAPMVEIGENSFAPAEIKVEKANIFRKIYLTMLKILDIIDYREIPFKQTICGLVIIITFKVIVSK